MIRLSSIALLSFFFLAACGNAGDNTSDIPVIKDEAILQDPFSKLLPWDATRTEVQTTPSGLQYVVLKSGSPDGPMPGLNDQARVHYDGRLASDGSKFDSSYDRGQPAEFGVTQVISGWTEALQLMRPGDDWMVYLPSDLAYGETGTPGGPIGPNSDLLFRMNLIETVKDETPGAEIFDKYLPWNPDSSEIETTENGLQYIVLESGDESGPLVTIEDKVSQHFEIRLAENASRLDSSFGKPSPQTMSVARLLPAWSQALVSMRPGDDWLVHVPATETGPTQDIVLRINLIDIVVPQVSDAAAWDKYTPWNSDASEVQETASGLEYIVLEAGDAAGTSPTTADTVEVYYEGRLTTGETFDSAYARGESIEFGVTGVIAGWTEALQLMRPGDRWLVYIPSEIAYGQNPRPGGLIKPGDDLIFEMQLVGVR